MKKKKTQDRISIVWGMNSIKTKLLGLFLLSVIFVAFVVGALGAYNCKNTAEMVAVDALEGKCSSATLEVNGELEKIAQAVDTLADEVSEQIDYNQMLKSKDYTNKFTESILDSTIIMSRNARGVICSYVRYNPKFTDATSGIFLTRNSLVEEFVSVTPTDFSTFSEDDVAVSWYYAPVHNGSAMWMLPYLNTNVGEEGIYMISYVVPLFAEDGTNIGIVGMDVDFNQLTDIVDAATVYDSGYSLLTDSDGNVVHSLKNEMGKSLTADFTEFDFDKMGQWSNEGVDSRYYAKELENGMNLIVTAPEQEVTVVQKRLINAIIIVVLLLIIAFAVIGILVISRMLNPLLRVAASIKKTADLELSKDEALEKIEKRKDEMGSISKAAIQMRESLVEIVGSIQEQGTTLDSTITSFNGEFGDIAEGFDHLNNAVEELADAASNQAQTTQEVAKSVSSMGIAVDDSVQEIDSLMSSVSSMNQVSTELTQTINELARINGQTKDNITEINTQTLETNESVQKISDMVAVIQDISAQTNLLSLNASIESARAGEAGRGFAVVAEEIRRLSDSSAKSAEEIDNIVKELIQNSGKSVEKVTEVLQDAGLEETKLDESLQQFDSLKTEVNSVEGAAQRILTQTSSLRNVQASINDAVSNLSAVSEEQAASIQESSANLQTLNSAVEECKSQVTQLAKLSHVLKEDTDRFTF